MSICFIVSFLKQLYYEDYLYSSLSAVISNSVIGIAKSLRLSFDAVKLIRFNVLVFDYDL